LTCRIRRPGSLPTRATSDYQSFSALWRKQNLATFQTAQLVKFRYRQIIDEELKSRGIPSSHSQMFVHKDENQAALEEAWRAAQKQA
jgi:hypothetical protein